MGIFKKEKYEIGTGKFDDITAEVRGHLSSNQGFLNRILINQYVNNSQKHSPIVSYKGKWSVDIGRVAKKCLPLEVLRKYGVDWSNYKERRNEYGTEGLKKIKEEIKMLKKNSSESSEVFVKTLDQIIAMAVVNSLDCHKLPVYRDEKNAMKAAATIKEFYERFANLDVVGDQNSIDVAD